MKALLTSIFVLFSAHLAFAGAAQVNNVKGPGGVNGTGIAIPALGTTPSSTFVDKVLFASTASATAFQYDAFYDGASSTIYSVPNGSTFHGKRICAEGTSSAVWHVIFGTSTATFTSGSATRPTNDKYFGGGGVGGVPGTTAGAQFWVPGVASPGVASKCWDFDFTVAGTLFPFWQNYDAVNAMVWIIGQETTP